MSTTNTANVKQWLEQSDIDYFTQFVKAWIPFNAWYSYTYPSLEQERQILDQVKTDGNRIRSRFMAKLEGSDPDSEEIRNHIAALHRRLSADPLEDRKHRRVCFEQVCVGPNPNQMQTVSHYGWKYSVERQKRPNKEVVCEVKNKSNVVFKTITQLGDWDLESFEAHQDYLALTPKKRAPLLDCYKKVNPYLFKSLLAESGDTNPLPIDGYRFVRDPAAIFAGLVDILYSMRNLLFHGELVPDPQANSTYEPAYHLLRHLTRTIV